MLFTVPCLVLAHYHYQATTLTLSHGSAYSLVHHGNFQIHLEKQNKNWKGKKLKLEAGVFGLAVVALTDYEATVMRTIMRCFL